MAGRSGRLAVGLAAVALAAGACGGSSGGSTSANGGGSSSGGSKDPVEVGLVYSQTGALATYGAQYLAGFNAGLDYVTDGTGKVDGHEIKVTQVDDAGDPAKAVSAVKDLVGKGVKIIAGTDSSGIAVQVAPLAEQNKILYISGPAATDAITGINKYTFRSGRETIQDVNTAASFLGDTAGKKITVFAQDSAFGKANADGVKAILGSSGATVDSILVPATATDFTPFSAKVKQAAPDLLFVAWAGDTTSAMWQSLDQQGVLSATTVVTGLADKASYGAYGPGTDKINFLSYYFPEAPNNDVNKAMVDAVQKAGEQADLFTPDGFVAAQMIARAIKDGDPSDVDKMVSALEGWTFDAPKGKETVRAEDHAMLQDMYQAKPEKSGSSYTPKLVNTVAADKVAPAVKK
jgi:branched-chain amino acid transport system substrate-binding protein